MLSIAIGVSIVAAAAYWVPDTTTLVSPRIDDRLERHPSI